MLKLLIEHDQLKLVEFEAPLAQVFDLSEEERILEYASGNGKIFTDRISWALSYLFKAGLLAKPKRGVYRISSLGEQMLKTPDQINPYITEQMAKRREAVEDAAPDADPLKAAEASVAVLDESSESTPMDQINRSAMQLKASFCDEVLATILQKSAREFEQLVVTLLQKMGYGGKIADAAAVTQYSRDGGIDGVIKEDVLGLGRVHIQAKRYAQDNKIGVSSIQGFVGALAGVRSTKGVFITTSSFTADAAAYAQNLNGATLVLIDGQTLANYLYEYGVGFQTRQVIEIKELDQDFWDDMIDDTNKV